MDAFKKILVFFLFVVAVSLLCIALNNVIFHIPILKTQTEFMHTNRHTIERNTSEVYMINGDLQNILDELKILQDVDKGMWEYFHNLGEIQNRINHQIFMIDVAQNEYIKDLERKHLALMRAHLILQKKHWSKELQYESSGWGIGIKSFDWEAWLKAAKTPMKDEPKIKDIEKDMKWEEQK